MIHSKMKTSSNKNKTDTNSFKVNNFYTKFSTHTKKTKKTNDRMNVMFM